MSSLLSVVEFSVKVTMRLLLLSSLRIRTRFDFPLPARPRIMYAAQCRWHRSMSSCKYVNGLR